EARMCGGAGGGPVKLCVGRCHAPRAAGRPAQPARRGAPPVFFFKQKTAYEIGLGIPAEPLFRSRKLAAERPLKDIRDEYNYPKKKGIKDECSRLLEASTMKSRRGFAIQRLMNAMRQAHADGWFIVFDTLTLADD